MLAAGGAAPNRQNLGDFEIQQAFPQDALSHHPGRAKKNRFHAETLPLGCYASSEREQAYRLSLRRRRAFAITETELRLIAALASIGLKSHPNSG